MTAQLLGSTRAFRNLSFTHILNPVVLWKMPQFTDICILMAFSFGVRSIFRDSPTGGRCTAGSSEARQEKVPTTCPGGDPSAGDSGTQSVLEFHISDFGDSLQLFIVLCNPRALTNRWGFNIYRWRIDINNWITDR